MQYHPLSVEKEQKPDWIMAAEDFGYISPHCMLSVRKLIIYFISHIDVGQVELIYSSNTQNDWWLHGYVLFSHKQ